MDDCLFCKIIRGEIPSKKVYEDETVFAFEDINPQAPIHVLIVPKEHIRSAADIAENNKSLIADVFAAAAKIAEKLGLSEGFRIVTNSGKAACQSVGHIHFHLIAGAQLSEKMG